MKAFAMARIMIIAACLENQQNAMKKDVRRAMLMMHQILIKEC